MMSDQRVSQCVKPDKRITNYRYGIMLDSIMKLHIERQNLPLDQSI